MYLVLFSKLKFMKALNLPSLSFASAVELNLNMNVNYKEMSLLQKTL